MRRTVWCLPESFARFATAIESSGFYSPESTRSLLRGITGGEYPHSVTFHGDTAVLNLEGVILRQQCWFWGGVGAKETTDVLERLRTDSAVAKVVLCIDSPGGDSYASSEIADVVAKLNEEKPVHTYFRGSGCSGAYWIACSTRSITAGGMAEVGSIGCYILAYDMSKMLEKEGIRPVMIRSAPNKGIGADTITEGQESRLREMVDSIADKFFRIVATSRKISLEDVGSWGDGGTWTGQRERARQPA